jgi:hypothetical protein
MGSGVPSRVRGLTTVASQHSASPIAAAPCTTKSRRRRSLLLTPGAEVVDSHCCGTIRHSGPTASRATRTQACEVGSSGQSAAARAGERVVPARVERAATAVGVGRRAAGRFAEGEAPAEAAPKGD